ncbi:MAG: cytochrome C assembly protein [Chloroflexi bacterium]|nr:MAG: cytochrome C assembly protein [Chloroflexota bacterium]
MSALTSLVRGLYGFRWIVLPPVTGAAVMAMIIGALVVAPRETIEGDVQRLLYIHFPSILAAYGAFAVVFVASLVVLFRRDMRWDAVARGAATVGVLFTGLTLATGALWGKPIWGVFWTWDARLTSTLVLFLIYAAYLLARAMADELDEQAARFAAVFAVLGAFDIPLIMFSVRWWRTLHPQPIVMRGLERPALPPEMLAVLMIAFLGISALAVWLIVLRTETDWLAKRTATMRALVDRREEK